MTDFALPVRRPGLSLTPNSVCGCLELRRARPRLSRPARRAQGAPRACERLSGIGNIVPQPRLHWSAYIWPGLPQVWLRGSWVGLTLAVGFTALANLLLVATLVWNEWLPSRARGIGLATLAVIWVVAWVDARANWRQLIAEWSAGESNAATPDTRGDQWFREAQVAYLAGDWVSAEQTLLKLLRHDPRDAESRLLLATLWRHEGRHDAAIEHLDRLDCLETAAPWRNEIASERERLCAASVKTLQNETTAEIPIAAPANVKPFFVAGAEQSGPKIAATNRRMAA